MHIWKEINLIKKRKFTINKLNEYFQIKYRAEPLTKPYTKSYDHVFYHCNCFSNKQIETYITFIEQYDTLCHCVSLLILTLSWEKKFTTKITKTEFFWKRFNLP